MPGHDQPPVVHEACGTAGSTAVLTPPQVRRVGHLQPPIPKVMRLPQGRGRPRLEDAPGRGGVAGPTRRRRAGRPHLAVPGTAGGHVHGGSWRLALDPGKTGSASRGQFKHIPHALIGVHVAIQRQVDPKLVKQGLHWKAGARAGGPTSPRVVPGAFAGQAAA